MIARASQTNTGVRFALNTIALAANNSNRFLVNTTGVGFNGNAAIARPVLPAAPTDATTTQQAVVAIRQALIDYGLCS